MTEPQTLSVVVERELPYPPEKIWRALTQPELIGDWLMKTDFAPEVGRRFDFRADWGSVGGEVLAVEPPTTLAYSWAANGLESVVTWTLVPSAAGTLLRMEHTGFPADKAHFHQGAKAGWPRFLDALEKVLARGD